MSCGPSGAQTLTVFGLHTPHTLATGADPDRLREDSDRPRCCIR